MANPLSTIPSSLQIERPQSTTLPFKPNRAIRNATLQTVVSTIAPKHVTWINDLARPFLIDAGPDRTETDLTQPVRLLAYYNASAEAQTVPHAPMEQTELGAAAAAPTELNELVLGAPPANMQPVAQNGLVVMLHGWGGCSHSTYNMTVTDGLLRSGFDVVRLNLRDHGPDIHVDGHALNKGIFYGTLLDEAAEAIRKIAKMAGERPFYIVGASMGGSFAIRLAIRHSIKPFHNLRRVLAICPSVNPQAAAVRLDASRIYKRYFLNLWKTSLQRKAALFPDLYEFEGLDSYTKLGPITDRWIGEISHHANMQEYYAEYSVTREKIEPLNVPTTIVTSRDDAVIPYEDIVALTPHPFLDLRLQEYGGHVGFVDLFPLRHCLPQIIIEALSRE